MYLRTTRRRFAGAERGSRFFNFSLHHRHCRVRAAEYAPRDPFRILEGCHGLAEIVERGAGDPVERPRVSPLAEQAKILCDEVEENNLGAKVLNQRWRRWHTCSLCEQQYHSEVRCALGWACWKTYVGRPETDPTSTPTPRWMIFARP